MATAGTRTTRLTGTYGTESDERGGNFEDPEDATDVLGLNSEVGGRQGSTPRRPPMGGIDLGKGLDLEKPRPPRSGIGIEVGKSAAGNLGIGVEIPLPVPAPISGRGGVSIDPATGKIRGGYGGIGIGKGPIGGSIDVGVDTPPGSDEIGCFKYVTVTLGPFSHTYGKDECKPKIPTPTPTPTPPTIPGSEGVPITDPNNPLLPLPFPPKRPDSDRAIPFDPRKCWYTLSSYNDTYDFRYYSKGSTVPAIGRFISVAIPTSSALDANGTNLTRISKNKWSNYSVASHVKEYESYRSTTGAWLMTSAEANAYLSSYPDYYATTEWQGTDANPGYHWYVKTWHIIYVNLVKFDCIGIPPPPPFLPSNSPPIPNPPPNKKKMDDNCCKLNTLLLLETLRMLGRQVVGGKLAPVSAAAPNGFLGERIKRTETPILDGKRPKEIEITFPTIYQLLVYALKQANNLDTALDPQSYKIPEGYISNPEYNRDSEHSLKENSQPDKDKSGNYRELEINEDKRAKIGGFLEQQQYIFNALRRLEYLFPYGELGDALIAKDLLIPGAKGDIKIHNMIMAYEIQMQYLNAALGNPRETLTIKDANPAIKGDQPIEVKVLTISDWIRQIVKFQIDTGGNVDAAVNLILRDFRTNLANRLDIIKTIEMTQALFEDSGMREQQEYISVHLEGDPYAGQWVKGEGFKPNSDLDKKTPEATAKVLQETLKPTENKLKVSRRHKEEKTDMRDLLRGLADFVQRLLSMPNGKDAAKSIEKLVESAKFKLQTEMALIRQNVTQAASASRNRTKKRKK